MKLDKGLIIKTVCSLLVIPVVFLVMYWEDGAITLNSFLHWFIHITACILVCETVHVWWHRHDKHDKPDKHDEHDEHGKNDKNDKND